MPLYRRLSIGFASAAIVAGTLAACHSHDHVKRGFESRAIAAAPDAAASASRAAAAAVVPSTPDSADGFPGTAEDRPITPMESVGAPAD